VERWFQAGLAKNPGSTVLLLCLAGICDLQERWDEMEALLRRVLEQEPDNPAALNNLAWMLACHKKEPAAALELIQRAIDLVGPLPFLLDTRGTIYLMLERGAQAVADLEEVANEAPTAARYWYLARAYLQVGKRVDAAKTWRQAKATGLTSASIHPLERSTYDQMVASLNKL
jgi:predicted Zn-dependent protease